jgi:FkbM family methyltransferase
LGVRSLDDTFVPFYNDHGPESWHYELFEPHPRAICLIRDQIKALDIRNATLHPVAAYSENCKKQLFLGRWAENSGLIKKKHQRDESVEVECIDFNDWMLHNISPDDNVHLHMDIEGAEYFVLPHMIAGGSIKLVKAIFVEFHLNRLNPEDRVKLRDAHCQLRDFFEKFDGPKELYGLRRMADE